MPGEDELRCTDDKLFQLCNDFDKHVESHDAFVSRFNKHEEREEEKFNRILDVQHQNTIAIGEVVAQLSELAKDTKDIVQLQKDIKGAARLGTGLQSIGLWCVKWGGIFAGLGVGIHWLTEYFSKTH